MWVRNNKGNVFVGNLPPDFPDERLAETFDPFGIVLSAVVARDPQTGARLRYGFVDIATERAAQRAVAAMNGVALDGHNLDVRISERQPPKKPAVPGGSNGRPRRVPALRLTPRRTVTRDGDGAAGDGFTAVPLHRQATFQVERRALPRRLSPR
jgi:cold-inducible RNA-binding protein